MATAKTEVSATERWTRDPNAVIHVPYSAIGTNFEVILGEYAFPGVQNLKHQILLDIGANAGFFVMWADAVMGVREVYCFEPNPATFECLKHNLKAMIRKNVEVTLCPEAVTTTKGDVFLRVEGVEHTGACTLFADKTCTEKSKQGLKVPKCHPKNLPICTFLKIDAEGVECEIIENYLHWDLVQVCVLEFHTRENKQRIMTFFRNKPEFMLAGYGPIHSEDIGVLKYSRYS